MIIGSMAKLRFKTLWVDKFGGVWQTKDIKDSSQSQLCT